MSSVICSPFFAPNGNPYWSAPVRALHWSAAVSLIGAAVLTTHGDAAHDVMGWVALGVLLFWQLGLPSRYAPGRTLGVVTVILAALNVSAWLAPAGAVHWGLTLGAMVVASIYGATVAFESLRRVEVRWLHRG